MVSINIARDSLPNFHIHRKITTNLNHQYLKHHFAAINTAYFITVAAVHIDIRSIVQFILRPYQQVNFNQTTCFAHKNLNLADFPFLVCVKILFLKIYNYDCLREISKYIYFCLKKFKF